jgi:hypothetical protein
MDFVWNLLAQSAFVWAPLVIGYIFYRSYMTYQTQRYVNNDMKHTMLEINIPKDVHKSPEAMEFIIDVLHHTGGGGMSPYHRLWLGAQLHTASLEIISVEGSVYFFMRVSKQIADLVKSTIYSQYPNAEVNEVDDYTKYVPNYNNHQDSWDVFGVDYKLASDSFLPIKTYVDYGLDKAVGSLEEEQKIDPLTPLLEYFGTIRAGEQLWLQIIVRADPFSDWRDRAQKWVIDKMGRAQVVADDEPFQTVKLSHGEQEQIKATERSLSKLAFETVIRGIYIAKKDRFRKIPVGFFKNPIFKPFSSQYLNSIRKNSDTTAVDWVWQDMTGKKTPRLKREFFNAYVARAAFYDQQFYFSKPHTFFNMLFPPKSNPMILTSEELATLFHIPGRVSQSTSVERIDATKAEPPTNLPM